MAYDFINNTNDDYKLLGTARSAGTGAAFADRSGGVYMWQFQTNDEIHSYCQLPHAWNKGVIHPHIHWEPLTTATYAGIFSLAWNYSPAAGTIVTGGSSTAAFNQASSIGTTYILDFPDITLTGPTISECIIFRLKLPTFTSGTGIWLWGWDLHYAKNKSGTISPNSEP